MAALRGVGEGLELLLEEGLPGFARADDSGAPEWVPGAGLVRVIGGLFSKLRAGVLTTALATSLLRCAGALSFFGPDGGAGVLAWGAREVMGTPESKTLQFTVRSTGRNRFSEFTGLRAYFHKSAKSALTGAKGDG
jgi:hypothetical protein